MKPSFLESSAVRMRMQVQSRIYEYIRSVYFTVIELFPADAGVFLGVLCERWVPSVGSREPVQHGSSRKPHSHVKRVRRGRILCIFAARLA